MEEGEPPANEEPAADEAQEDAPEQAEEPAQEEGQDGQDQPQENEASPDQPQENEEVPKADKSDNQIISPKNENNGEGDRTHVSKESEIQPFKISEETVAQASTLPVIHYIIEKIWRRFEAREYIENVVIPKQPKHIEDSIFKYVPFIMADFLPDPGECNRDKDDDFHEWEVENDYLPPKNDAHACDGTTVTKVQVFSPTIVPPLSDSGDNTEEGEILSSGKKKKSKNPGYLSLNAINELENKSKSPRSVNNIPFDQKSSTSRMTTINKLKMKAK